MKQFLRPWPLLVVGPALLLAAGCTSTQSSTSIIGNWAFTAPATQASPLPLTLNAGFTSGADGALSAVAHLAGTACVDPKARIDLHGLIGAGGQIVMTSQPFNGTTLTITGQGANGGKTITNAAWSFAGGSCGSLRASALDATLYSDINGTYTGTFVDASNNQIAVTATLTQTSQPDSNGEFQLAGSGTFPSNPCFTSPVVTSSNVTGSSLSTTYTEGSESLTAVGTFNSDATVLTVTSWQVTGGQCDGDMGTGTLTEQQQ
jgi:hypothetical protein